MTSTNQLNNLSKVLRGGNNSQTSSISLPNSNNARGTLDKYYSDCVAATKTSITQQTNSQNSNNSTNSQVSQALNGAIDLSAVTNQHALKVVKTAMYYSSPLRLMIKSAILRNSAEEKFNFVKDMGFRNEIKNDLISPWNHYDTFGLRVLTKIFRRYELAKTGAQLPNDYMFWVVFGFPTQDIMNVVNRHMMWVASDEERAIFAQDSQQDLQNKIANELDTYASFALDRRVRLRVNGQEQIYDPKNLIQQIHQKLMESYPDIGSLMEKWRTSDDDVHRSIGPTVTAYGGKQGPTHKKTKKTVAKSKK